MGIHTFKTFDYRPVMVSALVGSHNYCLNRESSDMDFKYLICPKFEDLYDCSMFTDANQSAAVDYTARDIRTFPELLWKGNLSFVEILFSTKVEYTESLFHLFSERESFAVMQPKAFFGSVYHSSIAKVNNIHTGTSTTKGLIESFGYDTKEAHHALRGLYTLNRYMETRSMAEAFRYIEESEEKRVLMNLKENKYTEAEFLELVEKWEVKYYAPVIDFFTDLPACPDAYQRVKSIVKAAVRIELEM